VTQDAEVQTGPPNFSLRPGAKPELFRATTRLFDEREHAEFNSATGADFNFAEMRSSPTGPQMSRRRHVEPAPHKDPKYPPTLMAEHVEGEVILYAVIRRDGSVDSIR
jgi:outer membrane biosynthesis protein TonB